MTQMSNLTVLVHISNTELNPATMGVSLVIKTYHYERSDNSRFQTQEIVFNSELSSTIIQLPDPFITPESLRKLADKLERDLSNK